MTIKIAIYAFILKFSMFYEYSKENPKTIIEFILEFKVLSFI